MTGELPVVAYRRRARETFGAGGGTAMEVKRAMTVEAAPVEGASDTTIRWLWSAADGAPTFALRLFEVQPGGSSPFHRHDHEHEVYVLSGRARLRGETQEHRLEPGDTALVLPGEPHQFVNAGPDTLRFLCGIPLPR
jgi:quercetin dioxygenase-like cupin family protein